MTESAAPPAEDEPSLLRKLWHRIFSHISELHVVAVLAAGAWYRRDLLVSAIFFVLALGLLVLALWQELRERNRHPVFVESVARTIASLFTKQPAALRLARIGALVTVTLLVGVWFAWALIDKVLESSTMDADINVVVARFHDVAGDESYASPTSKQVSLWLESSLRTQFSEGVGDSTVSVKLVDEVIAGGAEQAEQQALSLGRRYGANLVLYGDVLERANGEVLITPRFSFTGRESEALSTVDVAALVGDNALGDQIGPVDLSESQTELSGRSRVIVHFLAGLVSLLAADPASIQSFEEAQRLEDELGLPDNPTTSVFLGQAYLTAHTAEGYDRAHAAFERALTLNADHAGAYLGLANALYLSGRSTGDAAQFTAAIEAYDRAMQSAIASGTPMIPARAHLGRGNALLLLARSDETYQPEAQREYRAVVDLSGSCDQGNFSWWDPRGWGPWQDAFHDRPDFCPQMLELASVAETILANADEVAGQSLVLGMTAGPPMAATVAVDAASLEGGAGGVIYIRALGLVPPGLGAWEIGVAFNPGVLSALECTSVYTSACNTEFAPGTVRLAGANPTGLQGDVILAEVRYSCEGTGESDLELNVDVFADATLNGPRPIEVRLTASTVACLG